MKIQIKQFTKRGIIDAVINRSSLKNYIFFDKIKNKTVWIKQELYEQLISKLKKKAAPKKSDEINPTTEKNLKIVDEHLEKYSSWEEFKNNTNMENVIKLIDSMKTKSNIEQRSIQQFVSKIDQLNLILIRFYQVDKIDIIYFYKNIGLANFMKRWQMTLRRPKINDF